MKPNRIKITGVECHSSSEGTDELYITYQADAGLQMRNPRGFNTSYHMNHHSGKKYHSLDIDVEFDYEVLVTLWDNDGDMQHIYNDYLQSHDFLPGHNSGVVRLKNLNGADYSIYYTYLRMNGQTVHH